jgi:hypothetical protein
VRALGPALLTLLALPAVAGCGDDFAHIEPDNPARVADGVVFERPDGSSYELTNAVARCVHAGVIGTEYVYATEPGTTPPRFSIRVALGLNGVQRLPVTTGPAGSPDLLVVARDPVTGARLPTARARGEVEISEATCDPEPRLSFHIDARLPGPGGRPVSVHGGLSSLTGQ